MKIKSYGLPNSAASRQWPVLILTLALCWAVRAEDNTTLVFGNGLSTNLAANLTIGDTGTNNVLIITNGSKVADLRGVIGNQAGANFNSVLISGVGSIWTNRDTASPSLFVIGSTGSFNQVVVTNGGKLISGLNDNATSIIGRSLSSSNNSVTVTGTNSSWTVLGQIRLGVGPSNTLTISDGALVSSTAALIIGDDTTGDPPVPGGNRVVVTGSNSTLNIGLPGTAETQRRLLLGRLTGHNELVITNGGKVNSFTVVIGNNLNVSTPSTNLALVTGANSQWNVNGDVMIQRFRNEIRVENGALMTVSSNVLLGVGSTLNNNRITVDNGTLVITNAGGSALLNVVRGTNLLTSGTLTTDRLFATNGANSILVFNGGTLNTRSTTVSNAAALVVGNGSSAATLNLLNGTHSFFNGLRVTNNATLKGTGILNATTTVHGTLSPGASPGLLQIVGNLTLASNAILVTELNGTTPGTQYDQVDVTGTVDLSGAILKLTAGFQATTNDTFTIINNDEADAVIGTFLGLSENAFIDVSAGGIDGFFRISYVGGTGNDVVLFATVPEPSAMTLALLAGVGVVMRLRRHP